VIAIPFSLRPTKMSGQLQPKSTAHFSYQHSLPFQLLPFLVLIRSKVGFWLCIFQELYIGAGRHAFVFSFNPFLFHSPGSGDLSDCNRGHEHAQEEASGLSPDVQSKQLSHALSCNLHRPAQYLCGSAHSRIQRSHLTSKSSNIEGS
jgi:hypothetical protein